MGNNANGMAAVSMFENKYTAEPDRKLLLITLLNTGQLMHVAYRPIAKYSIPALHIAFGS